VPQYDVGTLVFSGRGAAPAFAVGTLEFHPRARPLPKKAQKPATPSVDQPPPVIDFSKIFGLPPPAPTTAPPTSSAPTTSQGPTLKKYLLLKHGQTPPLNSDLH